MADPSVYGSYMNFFLPQSAQVGGPSVVPTPGLFDMLGGMGLGGWGGSQSATPDDQKKRQQQNLAMSQMGMKMMQPPTPPAVPEMPNSPIPQGQGVPIPQPLPQVTPAGYPPGQTGGQTGSYPGTQGGGYPQRRPMPIMPPSPFGYR